MSNNNKSIHIPFLSEDEKVFLNTTATFSQRHRRNQVVSVPSLTSLWKRRDSSTSTCSSSSSSSSSHSTMAAGSVIGMDHNPNMTPHHYAMEMEQDYPESCCPKSPKARALESLIFEQPQRTVRLSLTPGCAV
ncbi:hypothetical protein MBANPS3_001594 [Mucor bainieri]